MELGPNQSRWLAALESGSYAHGQVRLHTVNENFCCLGVAAKIFKPYALVVRQIGNEYEYYGNTAYAPIYVIKALALWDEYGTEIYGGGSLIAINDNPDTTSFAPVIAALREAPERYFIEPR